MTKKTKVILFNLLLASSFFLTHLASAQNIEDFLQKYTSENGSGYMQPMVYALGGNLNSGFIHSAKIPEKRLRVSIGLTAMTAIIKDKYKTFSATTDGDFRPVSTVDAPTIFGSTEGSSIENEDGTVYNFPGGLGMRSLPLAVPQISVGGLFGTEVSLRYFASDLSDDIGDLNLLGLGIRHNVNQYIDILPLDVAIAFYWQNVKLENLLEAKTHLIALQGSKKFGPLTIYGGPGYEGSSLDISYTYRSGDVDEIIDIELKKSTSLRFTAGVALNLGPVYLHSDYNLGKSNTLAVGLGFDIGSKK
ncbi:DUF6588 family protein [Chondrinema litorale]|uniref:DUF6588 family protein n=1 Tax=Chondrinema litorale TaxID=2994555 RepID=UPI002542FD52|nr:DUF6588 family protein [Chondrinema litorale]UZR96349.1 hypothetical protein OQ292_22075 [Chondrinema litorale]